MLRVITDRILSATQNKVILDFLLVVESLFIQTTWSRGLSNAIKKTPVVILIYLTYRKLYVNHRNTEICYMRTKYPMVHRPHVYCFF